MENKEVAFFKVSRFQYNALRSNIEEAEAFLDMASQDGDCEDMILEGKSAYVMSRSIFNISHLLDQIENNSDKFVNETNVDKTPKNDIEKQKIFLIKKELINIIESNREIIRSSSYKFESGFYEGIVLGLEIALSNLENINRMHVSD